jgi:MFS family permease
MKKTFYGWWVTAAAFMTFGFSVGIPYYNISFFYDYIEKSLGWSKSQITFGFPLAALLTIWVGPLIIPKFSPRKLILVGTALTCIAFCGFGSMGKTLWIYYGFWVIYTVGYFFSGPIPHQLMVSNWFRKQRGMAMGFVYVGVGLLASFGSLIVKPLTERFGWQTALMILGAMMFLAWPLVIFVLKDKPSDVGQFSDGDAGPAPEVNIKAASFRDMLHSYPFWLLLVGSLCSIGSIGAVNFHMKFVFRDEGFVRQEVLNSTWRTASVLILWSSIGGRLSIGYLADRFPKKWVMFVTYFIVAATIPLLLNVRPGHDALLYTFAVLFGFGMGADYMLIPLMAAEQFGVNSLARAMAVILPVNTIGQTWFPYFVSILRDNFGSYGVAMGTVLGVALLGALAIFLLPRQSKFDATLRLQDTGRASAKR